MRSSQDLQHLNDIIYRKHGIHKSGYSGGFLVKKDVLSCRLAEFNDCKCLSATSKKRYQDLTITGLQLIIPRNWDSLVVDVCPVSRFKVYNERSGESLSQRVSDKYKTTDFIAPLDTPNSSFCCINRSGIS
jgi:hypothetical protein